MTRVWWRGVLLDERSAHMMDEAALLAGSAPVRPTQGSYSTAVGASAGTHSGGGAIDLAAADLTPGQRSAVVEAMRRVGWAAWLRTPAQSDWPFHVHGIAVQPGGRGDRGVLSSAAHAQVVDYFDGRNGLASRAPDDGPRAWVGVTWESYREDNMPLSNEDVERVARAVWRHQLGDGNDAGWHLRSAWKIVRGRLGSPGWDDKKGPPANNETMLSRIWQAVRPRGAQDVRDGDS